MALLNLFFLRGIVNSPHGGGGGCCVGTFELIFS